MSPAESVSSMGSLGAGRIVRITAEEGDLTMKILSRLRDLWELSNGYICLSDYYELAHDGEGIERDKIEEADEPHRKEEQSTESMDTKRMNIVREIISTEETYIQGLQDLIDVFPVKYLNLTILDLR